MWLESARIDYRKPAASTLTLDFAISDADLEAVTRAITTTGKCVRTHRTEAIDRWDEVCAVIETDVYVARPDLEEAARATRTTV